MFGNIPVGKEEVGLVESFLAAHDFASESRRAMVTDLKKLARWFADANREAFVVGRVTTRDVTDFKIIEVDDGIPPEAEEAEQP